MAHPLVTATQSDYFAANSQTEWKTVDSYEMASEDTI